MRLDSQFVNHYHHHVNWTFPARVDAVQILLYEFKCRSCVG